MAQPTHAFLKTKSKIEHTNNNKLLKYRLLWKIKYKLDRKRKHGWFHLFQPCTLICINFSFPPASSLELVYNGWFTIHRHIHWSIWLFYMHKMKCVFGADVAKYGPLLTIRVLFSEISEAPAAATSLTHHQHCQMHLGGQSNGYR